MMWHKYRWPVSSTHYFFCVGHRFGCMPIWRLMEYTQEEKINHFVSRATVWMFEIALTQMEEIGP